METILKNPGQVNQETIAMEIKFKLKESYYNGRNNRETVLKSCMDREEREVGVNSVGESRMDKTGGWKKVKGLEM